MTSPIPDELSPTLVLEVGYRGASFSGYAVQPGQRTVASELDRALSTFLGRPVDLTCAGRTDAGVHALAQYVSLPATEAELGRGRRRYLRSLTALLPEDISVRAAFRARPGFSARFDALSRTYRYRICTGEVRPVLAWDHAWWLRARLDLEAMSRAARLMEGEHDFRSMCKATSAEGRPTCRNVMSVKVSETTECGEPVTCVDVRGNAFLHSMVRTMTGTLVEVGKHRREPAWVTDVLAARERAAAGPCAPAKGLTFQGVEYGERELVPLG
ncbi:MAG: tRNA pseudouridine(38-40) synthase TruA [Atopobiaceae bacterium]|jgi:tRNA pseudouridine38-40 synthase|nr:tRNA pseudouridine(38-40) synthase TruA [Atopobiaceae bacterium]MCI2173956.1 tRNA pseudouridine(38-40) synthase TruA [Atopobiaceae bacterium]MCI2207954.1 tRNA pseudouridine(38-40) synthase TruA [Atopobiaceae bacterium]